MEMQKLRPGLLVHLSTSLEGNVSYSKQDVESECIGNGARVKWETTRFTQDIEEHAAAIKVRSRAVAILRSVCVVTSRFGLLCPESDADKLDAAIQQAKALVNEFNSTAKVTRLNFFVIVGKIAADNVEAARALNSEMARLVKAMQEGVKALDPKAIRAAANKANELGAMLSPEADAKVKSAISTARRLARRVVKSGESAAKFVQEIAAEKLLEARTLFIDLEAPPEVNQPEMESIEIDLEAREMDFPFSNANPATPKIEGV